MKRSLSLVLVLFFACAKAEQPAPPAPTAPPAADPAQGKIVMAKYGCGSCHVIPGVENARGRLGPALEGIGSRKTINGRVPNTLQNMTAFLENPRAVDRHSGMQSVGVKAEDARNMAAFLESLK